MNEYDENTAPLRNDSLMGKTLKSIRNGLRTNRKKYKYLGIISVLAGFIAGALFIQSFLLLLGLCEKIRFAPAVVITCFIRGGWFIGIPFMLVMFLTVSAMWASGEKPYHYDKKRGFYIADSGAGGSAGMMSPDDEDQIFIKSKTIEKNTGNILGRNEQGLLCALQSIRFINDNFCIFGTPGSGKSIAQVLVHIYQTIRRGESLVITDSKGTIYEKTAYIAQKMGYVIRVLNLRPHEMKCSDGVQFMKTIQNRIGAAVMANIIIENTKKGERQDFWDVAANNLLTALIMHVRFSNLYADDDKNLATVYQILVENDLPSLLRLFSTFMPGQPGYESAKTFIGSPDAVKSSAYQGLMLKLFLFQQPEVKDILSHDDIDFRAPMSQKCIYYVIIPDTDDTTKFLSCLFFTTLFNELMDEADRIYHGDPPLKVQVIMDEFASTGSIPTFDKILSVARSRGIKIEFILQNLPQLQAMYPSVWETIIGDCSVWMVLSARDNTTLRYIMENAGGITQYTESVSTNTSTNQKSVSASLERRNAITTDDISNMRDDELYVSIQGRHRLKYLNKYMAWEHPLYKVVHEHGHILHTDERRPAWRGEDA